jgi:phosphoribosyl-AMP cyclohydrolase
MLNYNKDGLIPAIIQDDETDAVLMLGYMNAETLAQTQRVGQVVFWSRSRAEVWHKGATSGDYLEVRDIKVDCENNSLLVRVKLLGKATCHTGAYSCYFTDIEAAAAASTSRTAGH